MKKLLIVFLIGFALSISAQEKATVYVARVGMVGSAINFKYFLGDQYLGKFKSNKYLKLQLDPGEHLIWAQSENKFFVNAKVEAGKTYVLQAVPQMGGLKARVILKPIVEGDDKKMIKQLEKIKKLIASSDPQQFDSAELEEDREEMAEKIAKALDKYENEVKGTEDDVTLDEWIEIE